jgi:hypothetical protein
VRKQNIAGKPAKKRSNFDWKFPQLKAITLSMHLKSILHIPGHGKPDFS